MSQIMEKFDVLKELNDEFKQRVKILYVFEDYPKEFNVLIVTKDDKTFAFGKNFYNQLGFGHNKVVNEVKLVEELCDQQNIDFANGSEHCIARNSSGKVYCWGFNMYGYLGIGSKDLSFHKPELNQYLNNEFVTDISCGDEHSLVLTNCGEVYAWGANYYGQIGNGRDSDQLKPIKVKGFNNERVVMISCGRIHSMALTECGHVYSWGENEFGQLGIENTAHSNEPKFVAVYDENKCNVFIEKISCGSNHSLLLSNDGNIYAFGRNKSGELGNQKEKNESSPHRIKIETKFIDISSRWNKEISIALSQNGNYYNWGQCGEKTIRTPKLTNFETFVDIYAQYFKITHKAINFEHQNSELRDKYVKEFSGGNNKMLQIIEKFDVLSELNDQFKQRVKILYVFEDHEWNENIKRHVLNRYNVLIVTKDDKTYAFGINDYGLLGFGHNKVVNEIQIVEQLCDQQIIDFANGLCHCIARNSSGKVYCWGWNRWGYLGIGSQDDSYHKPKLNQCLNNESVIDVSCGFGHTLVLTNSDEVYAWGANEFGQIGNGCNRNQLTPIKVNDFNNEKVVMISCGYYHSMAITEYGHVYSWGSNEFGQLGVRKKTLNSPTIIKIKNDNKINLTFKKISCGHSHSLLLSKEGVIYAFGNNECGQLGVGNYSQLKSPQKILHPNKFIDIKCHFSSDISIALSESNFFHIWGKCKKENIYYPREVKCESFDDIFAEYLKITDRALDIEKLFKAETKCGNGRYSEEFEEKNLIATGSYGIVCKAMDKRTKNIFAIKKIPFIKEFEEKALKEIEIFPKLKSDLVVRLESVWIEENYLKLDDFKKGENTGFDSSLEVFKPNKTHLLHIQMELCLKTLKEVLKTLDQELNRKHSEIMTSVGYYISSELFKEILESVDYLHKQKVIHRDLKPNNVLITDGMNGRFVKIADFGLATFHLFDGQSHTKYKGAIRYAAPEVMSSRKYDTKADIYSLGVILQEVFKIDINEPIGNGSELEEKYSKLFEFSERMTSPQKNKRPNCEEVLKDRNLWALSLSALESNTDFQSKKMKYSEDIFHLRFIEMKSRDAFGFGFFT